MIQQLLREAGAAKVADGLINARAEGVQLAADMSEVQSPETYVGYRRAEHFVAETDLAPDKVAAYSPPSQLALNNWSLEGQWTVGPSGLFQTHRPVVSFTASTLAICIWFWAPVLTVNRCVSKC